MILTPGESYREAHLLTDKAVDAHHAGQAGERDYLLKLAAISAQLARCDPETYVDAAAQPWPVHPGGRG